MRILMTTDTVGGVWNFTCTLTEQLLDRGHGVCLVSFGRLPSPQQEAWCQATWQQAQDSFAALHTALPLEWMQNNEDAFEQGAAEVLDGAACFQPDLILSNQFCFGRLATPVPRVVVAHSDVLSWATATRASALEPTPWLHRYTAMVQAGLLEAAAVVAPTAWMGRALSTNFFLSRDFAVIPNGTAIPSPVDPQPARRWQAITAGRLWDEAKGLDTLRGLHATCPLLVAGENTFESPDPAAAWPGTLTSLGPLSPAQLHQRFRESSLYLCTSHYEPFGLAPLEAALCGCAVICRDIPSLHEVWGDAASYFTDTPSLAMLLQQLGADISLLSAAQARAYQRACLYTPERMTDSYLDLFHRVLGTPFASAHAA